MIGQVRTWKTQKFTVTNGCKTPDTQWGFSWWHKRWVLRVDFHSREH